MEGRLFEAETVYKRSLFITESELGPNHLEIATTLANLGQLLLLQGRYKEARESLERALQIRESLLVADDPAIGYVLNTLGLLHANLGDYPDRLAKP